MLWHRIPCGFVGAEMRSPRLRSSADGASIAPGAEAGSSRYIAPMSARCIVPTMTSAVADVRSARGRIMVRVQAQVIIEGLACGGSSLCSMGRNVKMVVGAEMLRGRFEQRVLAFEDVGASWSRASGTRGRALLGRLLFLANALEEHHVGLEESADGIWSLYLGSVPLGKIDEATMRV